MNKGILGNTVAVAAMASMTISHEDMVLADEAFIEASELAHESETEYGAMEQALIVSGKLEQQEALATELMSKPELVNTATVAMARESMDLALAALGGSSTEFHVSTEAMQTAPLQAMEVTHEGIKDVAKKIYESIKMVFKKIALTIKKLAAKLIVAVDGTGKSAEKMLSNFKADSADKLTSAFAEGVAGKLIKKTGGYSAAMAELGSKVDDAMVSNLEAVRSYTEDTIVDHAALVKAATGGNSEEDVIAALKTLSVNSAGYTVAKEMASSGKGVAKLPAFDSKLKSFKVTDAQKEELGLADDVVDFAFFPTFVKGNSVYGVVFCVTEVADEDVTNVTKLLGALTYKNASCTGLTEEQIATAAKAYKVMTVKEIDAVLSEFKTASKDLKSFSDARMKDVDVAMKEIDKAAKEDSGFAVLNRISGSEFNRVRMFIAGNYISSIFAKAGLGRTHLSEVAAHIKQYNKSV